MLVIGKSPSILQSVNNAELLPRWQVLLLPRNGKLGHAQERGHAHAIIPQHAEASNGTKPAQIQRYFNLHTYYVICTL